MRLKTSSIVQAVVLSCLLALFATSCKTPEQGAYRTIGTLAHAVDATMLVYGDAYRAGLITPDEQVKVRAAYEHYQRTMRIARAATTTATTTPEGESSLNTALAAVEAASADLITLINLLK
jgi:hypothetical protein